MYQLLIGITLSALLGSPVVAVSQQLWKPKPRPNTCRQETTQVFVIDTSGSMKEGERFNLLKKQLTKYLKSLPLDTSNCQRIILSKFDTTADVLVDGYLDTQANRDRLIATLTRLQANGMQTNFDEAGKLIKLVWLHLAQNTSSNVPNTFAVRVLTDGQSAPSKDKPRGKSLFNLPQFLKREFSQTSAFNGGMIVIPSPRTKKHLPIASPLPNVYKVTIPIENLPRFLEQSAPIAIKPSNPPPASQLERSPKSILPFLFGISGAVALGLLGLTLVAYSRPDQNSPLSELQLTADQPVTETVKSLSVTEKLPALINNTSAIPRPTEKVLLGLSVPVTFGTKADCHYVIRDLPSAEILFSITVMPNGKLLVRSHTQEVLGCDDMPIPPEGMELEGYKSFYVTYSQRQWLIQPSFEDSQPKSMTAYFAKISGN